MKVLMIRPTGAIGGAETYNFYLIEGFKRYYGNVDLFFITTFSEFAKKINAKGAKAFLLNAFSEELGTRKGLLRLIPNFPKYLLCYLVAILKLYKKQKIDLICLQSATEKIFLTPILKLLGFKVIWIEHGPFFSFSIAKEIAFLYKLASHFTEKIITVSKNTKLDAKKGGIASQKLICVHTGIDTEYFLPLFRKQIKKTKMRLKIKKNEMIVGYLGNICQEKGIKEFLKVGKMISKKMKNVKFLLIGKGAMLNYAKKFVKKNHLDKRFIFTGFQKKPKIYLGIFDIIFYLFNMSSLSMTLMEAMAMEKLVVARDNEGNRELVVHKSTGYLFKNESFSELTDLIIDILKNRKKRRRMGILARKRVVEHFNLELWTRNLYAVFKSCLKNENDR